MLDTTPPLAQLYRKIEVTTKIRYNSARRLANHHKLSQWAITLISVVLILVPLFQAMEVPLRASTQVLNSIEVFLAVLVLAYSLLLGAENYAVRAHKMLTCGLELGRLARDLAPHIQQPHQEDVYKQFSTRYHDILDRYDNHDDIDYDIYRIRNRQRYFPKFHLFIMSWFMIRLRYWAGFAHYFVVFLLIGFSIWFVFN